ncbi:DUF6301 family protein [Nocardia vulneris]|uniref:Uncharacterized protein n=1 Tax=Nocardia vulneris TaxID=1141657 RepID=A0ABR4Z8A6_9NOCA|nr:DUF6301 family protein [Nocardia vulneris]KIA61516.1 hypothetical protein FG87_30650 [Nocardia vulneris]
MSDSVKVDVDAAVDFFRRAVEFDWTWGMDDVQRLSARMEWVPAELGTASTIVMLTKARLEKPFARFQVMDGRIDQVALHLTDVVPPSSRKFLEGGFDETVESLDGLLGDPILRVTGTDSKIFWNTPKFIGELLLLDIGLIASVHRRDSWGVVDELRARGVEI